MRANLETSKRKEHIAALLSQRYNTGFLKTQLILYVILLHECVIQMFMENISLNHCFGLSCARLCLKIRLSCLRNKIKPLYL